MKILILTSSSRNFPLDIQELLAKAGHEVVRLASLNEFIACPARKEPFLAILEVGTTDDIDRAIIAFEWAETVEPLAPARYLLTLGSKHISLGEKAGRLRGVEIAQLPLPNKNFLFKVDLQVKLLASEKKRQLEQASFTAEMREGVPPNPTRERVMVLKGPGPKAGGWKNAGDTPQGKIRWRWIDNPPKGEKPGQFNWLTEAKAAPVYSEETKAWAVNDPDADLKVIRDGQEIFSARKAGQLNLYAPPGEAHGSLGLGNKEKAKAEHFARGDGNQGVDAGDARPAENDEATAEAASTFSGRTRGVGAEEGRAVGETESHLPEREKLAGSRGGAALAQEIGKGAGGGEAAARMKGGEQAKGPSGEPAPWNQNEPRPAAERVFQNQLGQSGPDQKTGVNNRLAEGAGSARTGGINTPPASATPREISSEQNQKPASAEAENLKRGTPSPESAATRAPGPSPEDPAQAVAAKSRALPDLGEAAPELPSFDELKLKEGLDLGGQGEREQLVRGSGAAETKQNSKTLASQIHKANSPEESPFRQGEIPQGPRHAEVEPERLSGGEEKIRTDRLDTDHEVPIHRATEIVADLKNSVRRDDGRIQIAGGYQPSDALNLVSGRGGSGTEEPGSTVSTRTEEESGDHHLKMRLFHTMTLAELADQNSTWQPVEGYRIYLSANHRYYGLKAVEEIFPLWVYEGELAPEFLDHHKAWKFYDRPPNSHESIETLPEPVALYVRKMAGEDVEAEAKAKAEAEEKLGKKLFKRKSKVTGTGAEVKSGVKARKARVFSVQWFAEVIGKLLGGG